MTDAETATATEEYADKVERDLYELCQVYRHTPVTEQQLTHLRFLKIVKYALDLHTTGYEAGQKDLLVSIENWCRADPECSFNGSSSAWRMFDALKERIHPKELKNEL